MAQPPAYNRSHEFAEAERDNEGGRSTVRTADVDAELDAVATSINAIRTNIALNQRDDGEIRDGRVKLFTLASDVLALLVSYGATPRGDWLTATAYNFKDLVRESTRTYICVVAHTSGVFATDLAAGKWLLFSLGDNPAASAIPFTPTATIAATNVQSAINESDTDNRALSAAAQATANAAVPAADLASLVDASLGAALVGNAIFTCSTRTVLKALDTTKVTQAYLRETGREGVFVWRAGNYSAHIAADTQEGVYVKANAIASTSGAWVRHVMDGDLWETDWFGLPNANSDGTGTACHSEHSAMMATFNVAPSAGIRYGTGVYSYDAKPTAPTAICTFEGVEGGSQPTILVKRYADTAAGVLSFTTHAPRLRNLAIQAIGAGISAGNLAISAIAGASPVAGVPLLENVRTSMGTNFSDEILLDGLTNTTVGTAGYRTGIARGLQVFGNLRMKGCQHWMLEGLFVEDDFIIEGTSSVPSDDIHAYGQIGRHWNLSNAVAANGYITRCTMHGIVSGSVLNSTTNTANCFLVGSFATIAERNWDTATCRVYSQASIKDYGTNANGTWIEWGNGEIEQWSANVTTAAGDGTWTFPKAFPNTVNQHNANVTTAPGVNQIEWAQTHTATLTQLSVRTARASTAPAVVMSSVTVRCYAKGN